MKFSSMISQRINAQQEMRNASTISGSVNDVCFKLKL